MVEGFGAPLTMVSPVLTVPLFTQYGDMDIGIAMHPAQTPALADDLQIDESREVAA
jgi:hypothetical protein